MFPFGLPGVPGHPCQGEGPWSLCLGLPGRGAHCLLPLSIPLPLAPPPHQAFLTTPSPAPLPFGGLGCVTSSPPPMTLRFWSLQPHDWLWGFLLLLQPQTPFAILKQACFLLPWLSLVHISASAAQELPLAPCPTVPQADTPPSAGHHLCLWPRLQQNKPTAVLA